MFGSVIVDVIIGLIFVYLLLSLVCSSAKEGLEALMKKRTMDLERGLKEMLADPDGTKWVKELYEHPLIDGLFKGKYMEEKGGWFTSKLPSYIPSKQFADALIDLILRPPAAVAPGGAAPAAIAPGAAPAAVAPGDATPPPAATGPAVAALQRLREAVNQLPDAHGAKKAVSALINSTCADINEARANIEAWFNSSMDRIAGWYKRSSQWVIFCGGLLLVCLLNADSIAIANSLAQNPSLRQSLIAATQETVKKQEGEDQNAPSDRLKKNLTELRGLGLPIGWQQSRPSLPLCQDPWGWFMKGVGLLVTAFAITLGAPFWFDLLNKFMVVRSTVKPSEKSPVEKSKS